ncbi:MAG: hypothetical protein WAT58_01935 [Candidatus Dormiibacterota bacterium]
MANLSPVLLRTHSERERATRIGTLRLVVGSTLMIPALARRLFGVPDNQDNASLRLVARMFGIRNIVLGAWTLMARDQGPEQRLLCYRLNTAVDAVDVAALAWAGLTGEGLKQAAVMGATIGSTAAVAWIELASEVTSAESERSLAIA